MSVRAGKLKRDPYELWVYELMQMARACGRGNGGAGSPSPAGGVAVDLLQDESIDSPKRSVVTVRRVPAGTSANATICSMAAC